MEVRASSRSSTRKSGNRPRVCRSCGQHHSHQESHIYDYDKEPDEDLMCQICLQPFVNPTDTPCSHTFCKACISSYLRVNATCPICRKPLNEMTCTPSNLVLKRLLDKLPVICPHQDSCFERCPRGDLEDHLKYRCDGTLVACQYAGAGCDYRGPAKRMKDHQNECTFKKEGITRLPVLEGEVSHVEIPRTSSSLGITIVGGSDTPLRCVVVQEVFPDGLVASDGRLQPGDQIIEINGVDMTCASHEQVCAALRKMTSVLRLGVYRERIEKYGVRPSLNQKEDFITVTLERQPGLHLGIRISGSCPEPGIFIVEILPDSITALDGQIKPFDRLVSINGSDVSNCKISQASDLIKNNEKVVLVVARKNSMSKSTPIHCEGLTGSNNHQGSQAHPGVKVSHTRSKSAPATHPKGDSDSENMHTNGNTYQPEDATDGGPDVHGVNSAAGQMQNGANGRAHRDNNDSCEDLVTEDEHYYDVPEGEDYMALYETIDRKRQEAKEFKNKSASMEELETPTSSLRSFTFNSNVESAGAKAEPQQVVSREKRRHRSKSGSKGTGGGGGQDLVAHRRSVHEMVGAASPPPPLPRAQQHNNNGHLPHVGSVPPHHHLQQPNIIFTEESTPEDEAPPPYSPSPAVRTSYEQPAPAAVAHSEDMVKFIKQNCVIEGPQLVQKTVTIRKNARESLGMRIGGGIGSNEGDTPIYIANIHPHGCIGKSKKLKKGDLLLKVNDSSLNGLTHSQAVATLKATIDLVNVVLVALEGPETSYGASNFIPSWMYWQKLPRTLQYHKTVILHRRDGTSWGFSIVGGAEPGSDRFEPVHVLFVVPDSPAAKDGKLKCGDRLLAVDGKSLERLPHSMAVSMLKQTSTRVAMVVVSWMGTEL